MMPKTVFAQLSRTCNLRCMMCGHGAWQRPTGFMTAAVFDHVCSETVAAGIKRLALTAAQGEPLLAPQALAFIRRAIDYGLEVHLNTNITPLTGQRIAALALMAATGKLTVQCSFAGHDKASYERVYKGGDFDQTVLKLQALKVAFDSQHCGHAMTVRGVVYSDDAALETLVFLDSLGIPDESVHLEIPDNFAGHVENCRDLKGKTLHTCPWLTDYVVVYSDGKVSACACRDSEGVMEIGDLMQDSLVDIFNSFGRLSMLEAFEAKDISALPLCSKCDVPYF